MNKKYAGLDFPAWFDGKDVNEAAFCREFLSKNKLIYADNAFFTPDGRLTGPLLLKEKIYAELECCAAKNIPRTISNIVEIMKLAAHAESFPPKADEIHVQNGTLRIDGSFLAGRSEIVRSRFPIAYNPQAEKPVVWLRFLSDLLYPEDIPTFQEYIGYCLVPSTKGQRMMILKGEGGEGKSQIGPVLARLFGCNMKDGSIAKISDNRFARADLEHIHLLVDDDMKMEALKQTNYVKSIVTAQDKMDMFIVPDTQEAIVSQAQWDRVQELRKNKRRPVKAERQGLFAGLVYCADCGSKLHFAACKGFEGKQDHYRCSKYKSGRGECSAHYIREDVLRELVLERIQAVNAYIRSDVEGFQEEWLHYRRADQERDIREDQKRMEQAKKRLATLDVVISRLYEDYALGEISKEKYKKMTADYEAEQKRLKLEIETTEEWVEQRQAMGDDLDAFIVLTKKYVDVTELTQTIVNEYIKKIIIHAPDKSGGKRRQKVEIIFNFVDEVEIPVLAEPMIAESTLGHRKTA